MVQIAIESASELNSNELRSRLEQVTAQPLENGWLEGYLTHSGLVCVWTALSSAPRIEQSR